MDSRSVSAIEGHNGIYKHSDSSIFQSKFHRDKTNGNVVADYHNGSRVKGHYVDNLRGWGKKTIVGGGTLKEKWNLGKKEGSFT